MWQGSHCHSPIAPNATKKEFWSMKNFTGIFNQPQWNESGGEMKKNKRLRKYYISCPPKHHYMFMIAIYILTKRNRQFSLYKNCLWLFCYSNVVFRMLWQELLLYRVKESWLTKGLHLQWKDLSIYNLVLKALVYLRLSTIHWKYVDQVSTILYINNLLC